MEDAIGERPSRARSYLETLASNRVGRLLYLVALERGFLDSILDRVVVEPFVRLASYLTGLDRRLCNAVIPAQLEISVESGEDRDE
jgi:hypothetical protein